jgi:translation initiation factor IF-2
MKHENKSANVGQPRLQPARAAKSVGESSPTAGKPATKSPVTRSAKAAVQPAAKAAAESVPTSRSADVEVRRLQPTVIARRRRADAPSAAPSTVASAATPKTTIPAIERSVETERARVTTSQPAQPSAIAAKPPAQPVAARPAPQPSAAPPSQPQQSASRPRTTSTPPAPVAKKTGVEVWTGRPGVSMEDWNARQARRTQLGNTPRPGPAGFRGPASGYAARPAPGARPAFAGGARPSYGSSAGPRPNPAQSGRPAPYARPASGPQFGGGFAGPSAPARAIPGMRRSHHRGAVAGARPRRPAFGAATAFSPTPREPSTSERSAHKRVIKIEGSTRVVTLAAAMGVKTQDVLFRLLGMGAKGVHLNSTLDVDTAQLVANEFDWSVENVAVSDAERVSRARPQNDVGERVRRAPVVTVMGHVDHGKTTLLDHIRHANVAQNEAGGITQHIGAYVAQTNAGRVTFIDTPGHAAFGALRARGAAVTDVVVLVVAADDGLMPQTREAIAHAREARVPIVVAINKMDVPGADAARVRRELSDVGLVPEAWGGDTQVAEVSAKTGQGVDDLLGKVLLQAELLELETRVDGAASGVVIEGRLDKGQGPVASVLIKEGTLRVRDTLLVGDTWGKVRALFDDRGHSIEQAGPSTPVLVTGLKELPRAGDAVIVVKDVSAAHQIAIERHAAEQARSVGHLAKATLGDLSRALAPRVPELRLVVKADASGSVEALRSVLGGLSSAALTVDVVHAGVGAVTESDVQLAGAASALLLGFNVDVVARARTLARQLGVETREYALIYELADDVQRLIAAKLAPPRVEQEIGRAEVRQVFAAGDSRAAGSRVIQGAIRRGSRVRVERAGSVVWQGGVASLRRFRDDVREVREGLDCGVVLAGFDAFEVGDVLVASELEAPAVAEPRALAS